MSSFPDGWRGCSPSFFSLISRSKTALFARETLFRRSRSKQAVFEREANYRKGNRPKCRTKGQNGPFLPLRVRFSKIIVIFASATGGDRFRSSAAF
jgi:hypothetical protein